MLARKLVIERPTAGIQLALSGAVLPPRPLDSITTAALTAYDVVTVAMWALLFCLAARRSRGRLARDLFGLVLAASAFSGS